MINNNRQQNGRRRGRGGQRQGGGGNQGNGSRIDNRARGNAAQLLEKYKSLATEAQRQGDRVNTEYYLQFADHYFRVVSEQRGRFEEQDRQRREGQGQFDAQFDGDDGFEDGDEQDGRNDGGRQDNREFQPRDGNRDGNRDNSRDREGGREPRRFDGEREQNRDGNRETQRENGRDGGRDQNRNGRDRFRRDRDERPAELPEGAAFASEGEPAEAAEQQEKPRRGRPPRRETAPATTGDTFDVDRLPPSFAPANDGGDSDGDAGEAKPRRRRLRPAGDASQAG